MSGTLDHDTGAAPADQLLDLAAQVQRLAPPAGYDPVVFAREMAELGAEIARLAEGAATLAPRECRLQA